LKICKNHPTFRPKLTPPPPHYEFLAKPLLETIEVIDIRPLCLTGLMTVLTHVPRVRDDSSSNLTWRCRRFTNLSTIAVRDRMFWGTQDFDFAQI